MASLESWRSMSVLMLMLLTFIGPCIGSKYLPKHIDLLEFINSRYARKLTGRKPQFGTCSMRPVQGPPKLMDLGPDPVDLHRRWYPQEPIDWYESISLKTWLWIVLEVERCRRCPISTEKLLRDIRLECAFYGFHSLRGSRPLQKLVVSDAHHVLTLSVAHQVQPDFKWCSPIEIIYHLRKLHNVTKSGSSNYTAHVSYGSLTWQTASGLPKDRLIELGAIVQSRH